MAYLPFSTLRLIIVSVVVFAQIYLFIRIWRAIRSRGRYGRRSFLATVSIGVLICVLFVANWHIMYTPIPWVDPPTLLQAVVFYAPAVWSFGSIFSALLLIILQALAGLGRLTAHAYRYLAGNIQTAEMNPGRRLFLKTGVGGLAAAPFLLSGYGAAYAGRNHIVEELTLPFGCPLRVVQLTDIHAGVFMTRDMMRRYVDQILALQPELFVLTGDYISNSSVFFPGFAEEMGRVKAPLGTFATLGNHEHWCAEPDYYGDIFKMHGIHLLQNEHRVIRTGCGDFTLVGIDDLRFGRPNLKAALHGRTSALPTLLLSHRPEIFPEAVTHRIALTLSGHYHGGQVKLRLPGGDFSLAHVRTPYPEGLYRSGGSHLYVSRGIGTTFTPVRLNAPPEVTLFQLT